MDLGLQDRTAVVAGSSRGLGRAVALRLVTEGANVTICGRDPATLAATKDELDAAAGEPGRVLALALDVAQDGEPERLVTETIATFGNVDIVVPNAAGHRTVGHSTSAPTGPGGTRRSPRTSGPASPSPAPPCRRCSTRAGDGTAASRPPRSRNPHQASSSRTCLEARCGRGPSRSPVTSQAGV